MENCDSFKANKMHPPLYLSLTFMIIDEYKQKQHKHPVFDVIQLKPLRCTIKSQRPSWPESECPSVRSLCHSHSKPGHSFRLPDTGSLLQFRALQLDTNILMNIGYSVPYVYTVVSMKLRIRHIKIILIWNFY